VHLLFVNFSIMESEKYDALFKIIILGEGLVGKSSILVRFVDGIFSDGPETTVGVDFKDRAFAVDGRNYKLQIWDTAGQERFRWITSSFYRGTAGVVLVFSITDAKSFEFLGNWIEEVSRHDIKSMIIVGNKSDQDAQRIVSKKEAEDFIKKTNPNVTYIETSAKSGAGITEIFETLARTIVKDRGISINEKKSVKPGRIKLQEKDSKKKDCC